MQSSASIEEAMPQGGRGGGEQGCTEQGHEPATPHPGQGEEAPCHSPPPFPTSEMKKELGHEQQASLPHGFTEQDHSPSTGRNQGRDSATPPFPSTDDEASENHQQQPGADLPEGAIVEILSRVPYRSLCRFKCVSKPWLALCSDPNVRKRSPQTLSGFFFIDRGRFSFRNLSGRGPPLVDPSLHFLRGSYDCFSVEQCCSSLLLCKCWESRHDEEDEYDYVVCNPMTGQWTVLPPVVWLDEEDGDIVYFEPIMDIFLGFDAAAPSRFVVFVPLSNCFCEFTEMAIYLSETGRWTKVQSEWYYKTILVGNSECVFLNGTMHLATHYASVVTVDAEGKVWREIEMPEDMPNTSHLASIGQSQGRLYAWQIDNDHDCQLYVWVLEDYGGGKWTLKYTINISELFGRQRDEDEMSYKVFAIHPDCDLIFLTDEEEMAVSYDMENHKVNATCTFSQEFQDVLPYIPCFAEWSSDGH